MKFPCIVIWKECNAYMILLSSLRSAGIT